MQAGSSESLSGVFSRARPRLGVGVRWRAPTRAERISSVALALLVAGAVAVRLWLVLAYPPAFVGFGDSHEYVLAATVGVFHDVQKPAGYPLFLALLHALSDRLTFTILVQHALGVAGGVLIYMAVRRSGAPAWAGLLPAAVAFFGGTGLLLEHSLLADPLFSFVQAAGLYAAVRALREHGLRWALLAGLACGLSFWVKTVGLSGAVVLAGVLALGSCGTLSRRLLRTASAALAALLVVLAYPTIQAGATGYLGYERQDAWNLYGRVATFVDCSSFAPPPGTRFLCPREAPGRRQTQNFFQYDPSAPAVRRFRGPAHAPASANALLERFSLAAIAHQPGAYADAIVRSLERYITPAPGDGYTPAEIREALLEPDGTRAFAPALAAYYPHAKGYTSTARAPVALDSYESHTRVQGPLLVALLLGALIGAPLLSGLQRAAAALFTLSALGSVTLAAAGAGYDARYGYPAFAPLAAGAAMGVWGIATRVRARLVQRAEAESV